MAEDCDPSLNCHTQPPATPLRFVAHQKRAVATLRGQNAGRLQISDSPGRFCRTFLTQAPRMVDKTALPGDNDIGLETVSSLRG